MTDLAELNRTLAELKQRVADLEADQDPQVFGRRQLLRKLGAVGVGAVAASAVGTQSAMAANGDTMTVGMNNLSGNTTSTRLGFSTPFTGRGGFVVQDAGSTVPGSSFTPAILGYGDGSPFGVGVAGYGSQAGLTASSPGVGLKITASKTHIKLVSDGTVVPPATRVGGNVGEITKDSNGGLWYCIVDSPDQSNLPATWRKLSGPGVAGSLQLLSTPFRIYDSRAGQSPATGPKTPMTSGLTRTLSAAAAALPAQATGIVCNVASVSLTGGSGWFGVWASGGYPGNASVNWSGAGQVVNGLVISATSGQSFNVYCGGGGSADIIVDVVGYYS
jgi:hypothetical protein